MDTKKIVIASGGFDPIHAGHISYLKSAKKNGDFLIVALNSDTWLKKKKGSYFMTFKERKIILESLIFVDKVINFEDDEIGSCINAIQNIKESYPDDIIIFCNGGDRDKNNIPEMNIKGVNFLFGVGGSNKENSSSMLLKDYSFDNEERVWGKFYNLFVDGSVKVKELILYPKKGMSFQRHYKRSELWLVSSGCCKVNYAFQDVNNVKQKILKAKDIFQVPQQGWHQLINHTDSPCHIIEIQYGELLSEDDIERLSFYEGNNL